MQPGHQPLHLRERVAYRRVQPLAALLLVLNGDLMEVLDADQFQRGAHAGFQMVHVRQRAAGAQAEPAPGRQNHRVARPVVEQRAHRVIDVGRIEIDGALHPHDLVDPGLERRRVAVVVQRHAQHQHVGLDHLVHQVVALRQHLL